MLTSNDMSARNTKMMIGRLAIIVKEHAGYKESSKMFVALKDLASLNEALKDPRKVIRNVKIKVMPIKKLPYYSHLTI